ncbi:histidine phosphatase family protein [Maritalea porphyrae]|jgi:broad specificity phosphatase PhoE|uniref:histidine phosphatase family protein n=1 Tax=Maritalea porphyrae TaxID=880732 RepID=UPI0022AF6FC5|nr:histidine phosphatase family protein [Maritalea porphyrae]MCZ4271322.1 histidine phosphatase family protein [Maritalea porphyrae]
MSSDQWPLLYFIRHGQTDWNKEQRFQGQRDIPLNEHGRAQADQNGLTLRATLDQHQIDPNELDWFCSPLGRTRETMDRVRKGFEQPLPEVVFDDRLVEISFGDFEGILLSEIERDHPNDFATRNKSKWNHLPPNGENYDMLVERLDAFRAERLTKPSIVVAHGGVARALRRLLTGLSGADLDQWMPQQDKVMRFKDGEIEFFGS